jgi:hypothetical protein
MVPLLVLLALFTTQAPGDGWGLLNHRPREVRRIYHDLHRTTEVWVTLSPVSGSTVAGPRLAVQAFFPGKDVKGPPSKIQMKVLPEASGVDLTLRVVVDGAVIDLSAPGGTSFLLYPPCSADFGCSANGIGAEVKPGLLLAMIGGARVQVVAFGTPLTLSAADRAALVEFAKQVGVR